MSTDAYPILLVCCLVVLSSATPSYVRVPAAMTSSTGPQIDYTTQARYNVTGHVAWIRNPRHHWEVHCPNCDVGSKVCGGVEKTDDQAKHHNCTMAMNGGPFNMENGDCIGYVITNGTVNLNPTNYNTRPCFGLTQDGDWLLGEFTHDEISGNSLQLASLVCGFDFLIYNGSTRPFPVGGLVAPRTAIGINKQGELLFFEASGAQFIDTGLTMEQEAAWVSSLGEEVYYAINMDGGGSSVMYYEPKGGVQGCPTCIDIPYLCCVRSVTTIVCITGSD